MQVVLLLQETLIRRRIHPHIPIRFGVIAAGFRFKEPGMLVGCMIQHKVQNDAQVSFVRLGEIRHVVIP
jgi:hypothetical protein